MYKIIKEKDTVALKRAVNINTSNGIIPSGGATYITEKGETMVAQAVCRDIKDVLKPNATMSNHFLESEMRVTSGVVIESIKESARTKDTSILRPEKIALENTKSIHSLFLSLDTELEILLSKRKLMISNLDKCKIVFVVNPDVNKIYIFISLNNEKFRMYVDSNNHTLLNFMLMLYKDNVEVAKNYLTEVLESEFFAEEANQAADFVKYLSDLNIIIESTFNFNKAVDSNKSNKENTVYSNFSNSMEEYKDDYLKGIKPSNLNLKHEGNMEYDPRDYAKKLFISEIEKFTAGAFKKFSKDGYDLRIISFSMMYAESTTGIYDYYLQK